MIAVPVSQHFALFHEKPVTEVKAFLASTDFGAMGCVPAGNSSKFLKIHAYDG